MSYFFMGRQVQFSPQSLAFQIKNTTFTESEAVPNWETISERLG